MESEPESAPPPQPGQSAIDISAGRLLVLQAREDQGSS